MLKNNNFTSISLPYKKEYVNIITSFVTEVGLMHGANTQECMQLSMLGEEVFLFILQGVPKFEFDELFTLKCLVEQDCIVLNFSNHGEPIYTRNMDEFTANDPEQNIDNIGLEIIKNMSDSCEYVNKGHEGWSVVVKKQIESFKKIKEEQSEELEILVKQAARERLEIVRAEGKHAAGIIALMYKTYRYSYVKTVFYFEEKLKEYIDKGKILSLIAINNKGEIVGNFSASFESNNLAELGMLMIDPVYRNNIALLLLLKKAKSIFYGAEYDNTVFFNQCVTNHAMSQRASDIFNLAPSAIILSSHANTNSIGFKNKSDRGSFLVYLYFKHQGMQRLYIPKKHRALCDKIFAKLNMEYEYSDQVSQRLECESIDTPATTLKGSCDNIIVTKVGEDLFTSIPDIERRLLSEGSVTITCRVNAREPQPENFDSKMEQLGYIFCGLNPNQEGGWDLLYINLLYQEFDFDSIALSDELGVEIKEYIKGLYHKIH